MKSTNPAASIPFENALKSIAFANLHEAISTVPNAVADVLSDKKTDRIAEQDAIFWLEKLAAEQPNLPLGKAVAFVLEKMSDRCSPDALRRIAQTSIDFWENRAVKAIPVFE